MRAAIITEEQIKAIEDALGRSVPVIWTNKDQADRHVQALAIVKSLKAQEPVAWFDYDSSAQIWVQVYPNTHGKPLYAKESE